MGFVVELPKSSRYNIVIMVANSVSKRVHFILTHITITIESIVRLFLYYMWKFYGLFNHVVLDRGLQFVILFTRELYYLIRVEIVFFTAWHLQSDGQTKQVN